jgi:hypothetical protein
MKDEPLFRVVNVEYMLDILDKDSEEYWHLKNEVEVKDLKEFRITFDGSATIEQIKDGIIETLRISMNPKCNKFRISQL